MPRERVRENVAAQLKDFDGYNARPIRREAMSPPSTDAPMNPTVVMICPCHETHPLGSGVDQPRKTSNRENAKSATAAAHTDQASEQRREDSS
jgi:hypothetical protein